MSYIESIRNYILFLRKQCGLSVSLHTACYDRVIMPTDLSMFNFHENSYCVYMKTCPGAREHCLTHQKKVFAKAADGPFSGVCYAGVKEWVYPIRDSTDTVGFISVSGYRTKNCGSYLKKISSEYGLSPSELQACYDTLKAPPDSSDQIDTLLAPLCALLELAYLKHPTADPAPPELSEQILQYVIQNHRNDLTSEQICRHFSCSRSYLSRVFNRRTGMSIPRYITGLRMEDAKFLLEFSSLTVTQIALSVGFSDSNYFTSIFKEHTCMTPSAYRSQHTREG